MNLSGKKLVLGISGGIAAYKCADLARHWVQAGAEVQVIMTEAAQRFITPLTLETVSGKQVHTRLFPPDQYSATIHIDLADWADVVVVAPATADIISKLRLGQGDDLLTTVCLAAWKKLVVAPSMNSNMWTNPAVQENIKALEKHGCLIVPPTVGDLACGYTGVGRLADAEIINHWLQYRLHPKTDLEGKTVLVTAGRTEEEIDPVRIITNRSSGKMGFALAEQAFFNGARVILVAGPNNLRPLPGVEYHQVVTAEEMHQSVLKLVDQADVVIANAAVSDYRSKQVLFRKLKKEKKEIKLDLVANPDIIADVGKRKGKRLLIGFAVETHNEKENALEKMRKKNLDMIVLNNPADEGAGFATNTNRVTIFKHKAKPIELPVMVKTDVAARIMEEILKIL
jgi:phosphopantothenoylcysteine decarboxylase/phosphopantothenate--cysteine ligase